MKIQFVNLQRQNKLHKRIFLSAIKTLVEKADFISGKTVEDFEKSFAKFCNKKYALGVNSGTDALFLSLKAMGIGPGDEVITAANSYAASAMTITNVGATPILVDIDPKTHNIDCFKIEEVITKETKAIVPVHLYGQAADMDEILKIAKKYNLQILEDCCQAHGAVYKGKPVPVSTIGAFSFYPGKNLGCFGDGGIVVTDDKKIAEKIRYLRNDGSIKKYVHDIIGYKSRLDALQAAILQTKLPFLSGWNKKRNLHAKQYKKLLKDVKGITLPSEKPDRSHIFHIFAIEVQERDSLRMYLEKKGIQTNIHYPIPIHLQKAYASSGYKKGDFPISEEKAKKILSLPMFPELSDREIAYICSSIKSFFTASSK